MHSGNIQQPLVDIRITLGVCMHIVAIFDSTNVRLRLRDRVRVLDAARVGFGESGGARRRRVGELEALQCHMRMPFLLLTQYSSGATQPLFRGDLSETCNTLGLP